MLRWITSFLTGRTMRVMQPLFVSTILALYKFVCVYVCICLIGPALVPGRKLLAESHRAQF